MSLQMQDTSGKSHIGAYTGLPQHAIENFNCSAQVEYFLPHLIHKI